MSAFRLELEPYPVILGVKSKSEYLRVMEFVHIMHTQHMRSNHHLLKQRNQSKRHFTYVYCGKKPDS